MRIWLPFPGGPAHPRARAFAAPGPEQGQDSPKASQGPRFLPLTVGWLFCGPTARRILSRGKSCVLQGLSLLTPCLILSEIPEQCIPQ